MGQRPAIGAFVGVVVGMAVTGGCAHRPVPEDRASAALYRDLERVVTLAGAAEWQIDRIEADKVLSSALMSVCQVEPGVRRDVLVWLDAQIAARGGDVGAAYERAGRRLRRVRLLLELSRIRLVLARAIDAAEADCPFWLHPDPAFGGRQILDDRWVISFGGGGKGIVAARSEQTDLNFGGAGRLLFGRAFGARWLVQLGAEAGASASFPKSADGERGSLVLGLDLVTPVVARYRWVNAYVEGEAGYLAVVRETDTSAVESGFHVGVSIGGAASRVRWFLPGAAFGISYERTFPGTGQDALNLFKLGFRVAIDIGL